jgi:hypothetical protein
MDSANSFSTVKSASASIAFFHKINLFTNHPTMAPEVCMVRTAAARKFGLSAKRVKEPFLWSQLVDFGLLYGNQNQGYCHLVVCTMAILSFGAMCRYSDVSRLKWRNIKFEADSSCFEITFEIRKNAQFRQGNKVIVSASNDEVCPLKLLRALQTFSNPQGDEFIFRGFNGRLVAKNPGKTTPTILAIKYAQYMRYLSLWFGGILGLTPVEFKSQYGSQSGRIGSASAASNAGIAVELWGQHGDWASFKSQKRYMKRDVESLLSVSKAVMSTPTSSGKPLELTFDIRDDESSSTIFDEVDDSIPITEGVPSNTFRWMEELS